MIQPTLEELPVELRIQILSNIDDLNSLQSLVFASPEYHQAYQIVRYDILFMLLQKSYDSLVDIQDAIAAIRSKGMYAVHPSNRERIIALLDVRRRSEEIRHLNISYPQILPDKPADVVEVIQLLHLHDSATFLLDDYCTSAKCPQWMEFTKWHDEILPLQLSRTEKRRFIRAFYRLQTYGNIFGVIEIPLGAKTPAKENTWFGSNWDCTDYTFTDEEFWRLFLAPMAPWEVEELGCFWHHCLKRWVKPYTEISDSLLNSGNMNGTMFITELPIHEQPPVYRYIWDTDDLAINAFSVQDSLVSMGPSFLVRILREPDFMTRRNLLLINALGWCHSFPDFWLRPEIADGALPLLYPADKFNFGTDFPGLVKLLDSLPDHKRPNLPWRQRWLGNALAFPEVFEDMFNYAPLHARWKWGYAFWDDDRIIQWGTPNMENQFPGNDP